MDGGAGPCGCIVRATFELHAAEIDPRGSQVLGWQTQDVARVVSFTPYGPPGSVADAAGPKCLSGYLFHFDVFEQSGIRH